MRTLVLSLTVVSFTTFAKPPTCKERVKSLTDLAATATANRDAALKGPVSLSLYGLDEAEAKLAEKEGWKERGVRITTTTTQELMDDEAPKLAAVLNKLVAATSVELCIEQGAPIEQRASKDASPKVLAPLLKMASGMDARDRATVLAGELSGKPLKCKGIKEMLDAVVNVQPGDRLPILLQGTVETLEPCKCSAAEVELIYAAMTLMADVWEDKRVCAKATAPKSGAGTPIELKGRWADLADRIGKAPGGVTFK